MIDDTKLPETRNYSYFCSRAKNTNIHSTTLLATDYLNHFNEVIMLLEMIPDMPECMEDAGEWAPKSYAEHFRDSAFSDKDLAIEAYAYVPDEYKHPFETVIDRMNELAQCTIENMQGAVDADDRNAMEAVVEGPCRDLRAAAETAGAIINGQPGLPDPENMNTPGEQNTVDQRDIDDLFA